MHVTPSGILTDVSPEQPSKAWSPMLVTLSGILTDVSSLQKLNAEFPMLVTPSGMVVLLHPFKSVLDDVSIIALQLFRESYLGFAEETEIETSELQ